MKCHPEIVEGSMMQCEVTPVKHCGACIEFIFSVTFRSLVVLLLNK